MLEAIPPAVVGEDVFFDHASEDGDAGIESEQWTFGDGVSSIDGWHIYTEPGTYTVTLTVADRYGQTSTATSSITVTG